MSNQNKQDPDLPAPSNSLSRPPSNEIIPSPSTLQEYENASPGSIKIIFSMAEKQLDHRIKIETRDQEHRIRMEERQIQIQEVLAKSDIRRGYLGLAAGFAIVMSLLGLCTYFGINDQNSLVSALLAIISGGTLSGIISIFVIGNKRQEK